MPLTPNQRKLTLPSSPSLCAGRKLGDIEKALVWKVLHDDPQCPSRLLLDKVAQAHAPIEISIGHLNRLRRQWQLNRPKGRPRHDPCRRPATSGAKVVRMGPHLSYVGVHLFAHWLDQQGAVGPVVAPLTQAVEAHQHAYPDDDFALLHHREQTLLRHFQALFFAPLVGIEHLTAFDTPSIRWPRCWVGIITVQHCVSSLGNSSGWGPTPPSCWRCYRPKRARSPLAMGT